MATVAACALIGSKSGTSAGDSSERAVRLIGGPVLFRFTGYEKEPRGSRRRSWRYLMVFRLNANPAATKPQAPEPAASRYGDYLLVGSYISFDDEFYRDSNDCFVFATFANDRWQEPLDKLKVGHRVKVRLRPLTPNPDGSVKLGKTYVTRPTLRRADVRLRDPAARRQLKRIGCPSSP